MMDKAGMQGFGGVTIVVHDKNSNALAERETRPRRRWRSDRSFRYSHCREFDHELAAFPYAIAPGKHPATVLANLHAAAWTRYLRSGVREVIAQQFILAARGRGIPERIVRYRHALRNALLPFLTVVLLDAAIMVSGAVVTESVFAWPGLGGLFTEALARRDYTVLMAFLMISSTAVIVLNLLADLSYHLLDPRVRR